MIQTIFFVGAKSISTRVCKNAASLHVGFMGLTWNTFWKEPELSTGASACNGCMTKHCHYDATHDVLLSKQNFDRKSWHGLLCWPRATSLLRIREFWASKHPARLTFSFPGRPRRSRIFA